MIPISKPKISRLEIDYVTDAVKTGWVSSLGPYIEKFEEKFAEYCGVKYALSVANGTVGLHLALKTLEIGDGDEVIIPDLTFVATANAVVTAQAVPVIVDVCRDTYCIDPLLVERAITNKTRAIIPVHLYGHPANMSAINELARKYNLKIIEDAAEAHGASINGVKVGALGDCGVFSFYGNKIITSGEGGMITTNSYAIYERAKLLRDHAMSKSIRYWHTEVGYNYRMTNMQAALGLAQLEQIDEFIGHRKRLLELYATRLQPSGIECNPKVDVDSTVWMVCAVLNGINRSERDSVIKYMRDDSVDSRPFFFPLSMMPMYKNITNPIAYYLSESALNLPTFVDMTEDQVTIVCNALLSAINRVRQDK